MEGERVDAFFHSVRLDEEKCEGCINCVKRCPTQAIRVRNGKASIISELCIDCGECIRICPHHAKYAQSDSFNMILNHKYRVALPAPTLYGQFNNLDDTDYVLSGLKNMGFDDVFEVSAAAELVSAATREMMNTGNLKRPVISSACPAVCRLIRIRFPKLIPNVLDLNAPMEEAGRLAREKAVRETGLKPEEIGVFFITPCPAKITAIKAPIRSEKSNVDGAFPIKLIYPVLLKQMEKLDRPPERLKNSGIIGVSWAGSGGESSALMRDRYLAADGIENVINVLEELEDEKLNELDFIELNACSGGCVGGVLTVENPYVARARLQKLRQYMPVSCNHLEHGVPAQMHAEKQLEAYDVMRLADNVSDAMDRLNRLNEIHARLPGLDCGVCGAPSCRSLAEDIVRGTATIEDCVFTAREEFEARGREGYIPAPFRKAEEENHEGK